MRLLFVLSQIEVTGAETYALTLARALRDLGHEVILVSEKLRDTDGFKFHFLPLHTENSSYSGRVKNSLALRGLIQSENIDLVHSHSRAANLVSHFAVWNLKKEGLSVPLVVTVHGRWRNHFAARNLPCLGRSTVAVCPHLKKYLVEDIKIPAKQIRMVPNAVDSRFFSPSPLPETAHPVILYIGRFSGQKGNVIRYLLKNVFLSTAKQFPDAAVKIAPGLSEPGELGELVARFNAEAKRPFVQVLDASVSLPPLYQEASVVIGSGRVAMEAMLSARPVIAIGESSAPGLLSADNFDSAFDSNFGDCGEWNLFLKSAVEADLAKILTRKDLAASLGNWGREKALQMFDSKKVALQIEAIYKEALASRG